MTAKTSKTSPKGTKHVRFSKSSFQSVEEKVTFDHAEDGNGYKLGTELKIKQVREKGTTEVKLTPTKVKIEKSCRPDQVNNDTATGSFLGKLEHKIGDDKPDLTAGFTYGRPKLNDDVAAYFEGNVTYKGMKEWAGDISGLLSFRNQFYLGSQIFADLKTKKATDITGIAAAEVDGHFLYMHAHCLKNIVRVGFSTKKLEQFGTLAAETEIALKEKGPIQDRTKATVAFDTDINEDSKLKMKLDITKKLYGHFSFIHKINDNLSITFTDALNPLGLFKDRGQNEYNIGISLDAKF